MVDFDDLDPDLFDSNGAFDQFDYEWLRKADARKQRACLLLWFLVRYADPAEETQWDNETKQYIYHFGGPYDPHQVLQAEFEGVVGADVVKDVADYLAAKVGREWAPRRFSDIFDERFQLDVAAPEQPYRSLSERNDHALALLESIRGQAATDQNQYLRRLVYSSLITNLESFLWETADYWVSNRESVVRSCIENCKEFQSKTIKLSDLFTSYDGAEGRVRGYLQKLVWHRFVEVTDLYAQGLGVTLPSLAFMDEHVQKRHHIIHRSGNDFDGNPVDPSIEEIEELAKKIKDFARATEDAVHEKLMEPVKTDF